MNHKVHDPVMVAVPAGTLFDAEIISAAENGDSGWYVVEIPAIRLTVPGSALAAPQPPEPDPIADAIHAHDPDPNV